MALNSSRDTATHVRMLLREGLEQYLTAQSREADGDWARRVIRTLATRSSGPSDLGVLLTLMAAQERPSCQAHLGADAFAIVDQLAVSPLVTGDQVLARSDDLPVDAFVNAALLLTGIGAEQASQAWELIDAIAPKTRLNHA